MCVGTDEERVELPPIHKAIKEDDMAEVSRLVGEGFVNQRTKCGKTPLMTAGYYCRKAIISYLIGQGAVVNAIDEATGCTAAHFIVMSLVCIFLTPNNPFFFAVPPAHSKNPLKIIGEQILL